ncbi:MAG: helix-turn-helix transcriptional regulator [Pseudoflavonifractor sp.]|nr:helix-turn-helix transcriptional regulator [Pseudoflavonifractor sp.]
MVTLAQRIEALRTERNLSRPALAAALGFPRLSIEKFETGRQTPTQEQQSKIAAFFDVSLFYLRGESNDRTTLDNWINADFSDEPALTIPAPRRPAPQAAASPSGEQGTMFDAFLSGRKFQDTLHAAVLEVLRSPEGQELLSQTIRKELGKP